MADAPAASVADAAEKVRATARWVIAAFGAIGAAIAASLPFSDVGKLSGGPRFWALVVLALAYAGITGAIFAFARLLLPHATTLGDLERIDPRSSLQELLDAEPALLSPYASVEELTTDVRAMEKSYRDAFLAWHAAPTTANAQAMDAWADAGTLATTVRDRVVEWSNYGKIESDYRSAMRRWVLPGMIAAALGIVMLALQVSKPPAAEPSSLAAAAAPGASLLGVQLRGANLTGADLSGADLSDADLSGATLDQGSLAKANLTGANLDGASLAGTKLGGVVWSATTCPDGTNSDDVNGTCVAHLHAKS